MTIAAIGKQVNVADMAGDRPAIITKVLTNTIVEVCAFTPEPTVIDRLRLHDVRAEAIHFNQADGHFHGYWPAKV